MVMGWQHEVLLVGNTDFITKQWIQHAFPRDHVVIAEREGTVDGNDRLRIVNMSDANTLAETLTTYEFDRIVFFSENLTPRSDRDGDLGTLRRFLHAICNRQTQILMVSGPESEFTYPENADVRDTSKSLMSRASEELCLYYARTYRLEAKIIRSPYLYASDRNGVTAYFNHLFEQAESGTLSFCEQKNQQTCFLCADDLAELIYRMFDDWTAESEIFHVPNVFNFTYGDLADVISAAFPGLSVTFGEDRPQCYPADDHVLRLRYGWSPRYSLKQDLPPILQRWKEARAQEQSGKHPIWDFLRNHSKPWIAIEIFITFILEELLRAAVQGNSQLETVDLRLFFVVIVGTMYGLNAGVLAAVLACAGMALSYASKGASFAPLFYDTSNWLAFVVYFVAGAVCGYVQLRNRENLRFMRDENSLLRERLAFLRDLYHDVLDDRRMLRGQIIGRRDSFGKMYAMTRELDEVLPRKLYYATIRIMQDTLGGDSFGIYRIDNGGRFAHLMAASPQTESLFSKSALLENYTNIVTALDHGRLWVNRNLEQNLPMYAAGVRADGKLAVVIVLAKAQPDQMNLYFQNLFTIMCGLVESAMVRAFDYENVARQTSLVPGTEFLNTQAFLPKVLAANELKRNHMSNHLLLRVEDAWQDDGSRLMGAIRQTDEAGVLQDGNVYVLMDQVSEHELPIINRRLSQAGLHVTLVSDHEEDSLLAEASEQVVADSQADETPRSDAASNDSASYEGGAA
ncbi:nucleoside-diphosphate sugar epimerase [Bifidobacterium longum subsp. suis]|uniref:NAD-dependent epimerase/dehydratase family protein n=1 Tax=Bifidobacterium longum TaxID=216816 RepID=UPI003D00593B